jgi:hypothetical protein
MTGKLYAKHGGVFIESGLHTSDFAELTESVKRLETENARLNALYDIALGNITMSCDDMTFSDVRAMIEKDYERIREREKRKAAI